jgi:hypothetical protein
LPSMLMAILFLANTPVNPAPVNWSRLSAQILRVDKWSVCRG